MKRKLLMETLGLSLPRDQSASPKCQQNSVGGARILNEMTLQNVRVAQCVHMCACKCMHVAKGCERKTRQRQTKRYQSGAKSTLRSAL